MTIRHLMTLCESLTNPSDPVAGDSPLCESAPPGKKAERFIKKHKKEFNKRYGKHGENVLYATAWKNFGKRKHTEGKSLHDYLALIEGAETRS